MIVAHPTLSRTLLLPRLQKRDKHSEPLWNKKGKLASAFGELLRKAWSPARPAIRPCRFQWRTVALPNESHPRQQHDSQEFLAYILDCLHEDLNSIKFKPYDSERPSADGHPDEEEVADMLWADHKARNGSVIADTFHVNFLIIFSAKSGQLVLI